jgi:HK97 gp10 family phage protein
MASFEFTTNINNINNAMEHSVENILTTIGLYGESQAKLKITEMDAIDTGYLRNSIDNKVSLQDKKVSIGTNTDYSIYVHEGTRKMRARPFLKDAIYENIENIQRLAEQEITRGLG